MNFSGALPGLDRLVEVCRQQGLPLTMSPPSSNVDRLFDTYSRYLEVLVQSPEYEPGDFSALIFPWQVPELISRDESLVELLNAGRFEGLMTTASGEREWLKQVTSIRV